MCIRDRGCTGIKRTTGQHPGGIIVVPKGREIYEFCPVQHPADDPNSDIITTHFDYHSIDQNLLKLDILGHDDPTMIRMLYDITGIDPTKVPLDDKETMSIFSSTDALGVTPEQIKSKVGSYGIPEFGTKFVRGMLVDTKPTTFDELIRISGLSHGTDVWLGNAQSLIDEGTVTLNEAICCRDDIMIYLIKKGLPPNKAFKIMETVRKGKALKDPEKWAEFVALMRDHDVPEWYIKSCEKIKYCLLYTSLHSKHVDKNPGDRQETCHGDLEPVSLEIDGKKGYVITVSYTHLNNKKKITNGNCANWKSF